MQKDVVIYKQAAIDALDGGKMIMMSIIDLLPENVKNKEAKIRIETICATIDIVKQTLGKLPPAQPEIVRCKDCKWWSNDDYRECSSPNYDDGYVTPAGFYCGYAERKDDE